LDEGYGRFGSYSRVEVERFFHLDDEDRRLVAMRRRDYNRLGFAVQMVTVRHLGMFLPDPLDVPLELVEYLAEQLGINATFVSTPKSATNRSSAAAYVSGAAPGLRVADGGITCAALTRSGGCDAVDPAGRACRASRAVGCGRRCPRWSRRPRTSSPMPAPEIGFGVQFTGARGRHAIHRFESGYASPLTILGTLPGPDYHRWRAAPDRALLVPFA